MSVDRSFFSCCQSHELNEPGELEVFKVERVNVELEIQNEEISELKKQILELESETLELNNYIAKNFTDTSLAEENKSSYETPLKEKISQAVKRNTEKSYKLKEINNEKKQKINEIQDLKKAIEREAILRARLESNLETNLSKNYSKNEQKRLEEELSCLNIKNQEVKSLLDQTKRAIKPLKNTSKSQKKYESILAQHTASINNH